MKMGSKGTRKNHYLPQVYLRQFTTDGGFWVYTKGKKEPTYQTPINTGAQRDIYNYKKPDGSIDDSLEKALSTIENDYKAIIDRLSQSKSRLKSDDIENLAVFFSYLACRVPKSRELAREIYKEIVMHELRKLSRDESAINESISYLKQLNKDSNITADYLQEFYENPEKKFKLSIHKQLAMLSSIELARDIFHELENMNWCLCRAQSDMFITSDAPVVPYYLRYDGLPQLGSGFGLPNVEVSIPISSELCIFLTRTRQQNYRAVNRNFIVEINRRTAWNAEEYIISSRQTELIDRLVVWSAGSTTQPKIDKDWFRALLTLEDQA